MMGIKKLAAAVALTLCAAGMASAAEYPIGKPQIHRYVIGHDCGTVINPDIVRGMTLGGIAHGIGAALLEEFAFDGEGQLLTQSFMDYLLPSAHEVPEIEIVHHVTPSPHAASLAACVQPIASAPVPEGLQTSVVQSIVSPHVLLSGAAMQPVVGSDASPPGAHVFVVHEKPSLHAASSNVCKQPVIGFAPPAVGSHASVEHVALSLHTESIGVCMTVPVCGSQASAVHSIWSSTSFAACSHVPALQVSSVHAS